MIQNKYYNWYYKLINKAKKRIITGYTETHHIIPKSLGGQDILDNMVELTAREHFIAHLCLVKMTKGSEQRSMIKAAYSIINWKNKSQARIFKVNNRVYETLKTQHSENMKKFNPMFNEEIKAKNSSLFKKGQVAHNKGKKATEEAKLKQSMSMKGRAPWNKGKIGVQVSHRKGGHREDLSVEARQRISEKVRLSNLNRGPMSEDTKNKLKKASLQRWANWKKQGFNPHKKLECGI